MIENKFKDIKIVILGKSLVGKSTLIHKYINNIIPPDHDTAFIYQFKTEVNDEGKSLLLGKNILN